MLLFEYSLIGFAGLCLFLGGLGILWGRCSSCPHRTAIGRILFVGTLLMLGAVMQLAAFYQAEGIVPLGLLAGLLVVLMLWESPSSHVVTHRI